MPPSSSSETANNDSTYSAGSVEDAEKKETGKPLLSPEQTAQREKKISSILTSVSELESQIDEIKSQVIETSAKLKSPNDANKTVQNHIRLLHSYNEIRDIGQGLLGLLADARGVRHIDVQREFGVAAED